MRRVIWIGLSVLFGGFLLIQLDPVRARPLEPAGDRVSLAWANSPETRALARCQRACFDCHSNETDWPWYTNIVPVSWLSQQRWGGRRGEMSSTLSEWDRPQEAEVNVPPKADPQEGEMPPWY